MRSFAVLVATLALTGCANTHPVKTIGPDTYQISHTFSAKASPEGPRNGLLTLAQKKCNSEDGVFNQQSENTTVNGNRQTLLLTFACKPQLKASGYNAGFTENRPTAQISYTAPIGVKPEDLLINQK